jgi:gluconate 2-dehydrogenase gamma chain
MSEISRRDALRRLGLTLAATGLIDTLGAREVHALVGAQTTGAYVPKSFTPEQYKTLERLTDLIIPVENGAPGAVAAGCAQWIDTISSENEQLKKIYRDGFAWLEETMKRRVASDFLSASTGQQTALLDLIAYRRNETPDLAPGIQFFSWVRRMTVDAFYTSEIGFRDIDYRGNSPQGSYPEPTEAIAYALKKSGL